MNIAIQEFNNIRKYLQLPPHVVAGIGACVNSAFGGRVTELDARNHMAGDQILIATDEGRQNRRFYRHEHHLANGRI